MEESGGEDEGEHYGCEGGVLHRPDRAPQPALLTVAPPVDRLIHLSRLCNSSTFRIRAATPPPAEDENEGEGREEEKNKKQQQRLSVGFPAGVPATGRGRGRPSLGVATADLQKNPAFSTTGAAVTAGGHPDRIHRTRLGCGGSFCSHARVMKQGLFIESLRMSTTRTTANGNTSSHRGQEPWNKRREVNSAAE